MIDERFAASVSAWLRRSDGPPRSPDNNVGRAMAQIRHTRQSRRWLRFLPGRMPTAGASDEFDGNPASAIPPTDEVKPRQVRGTGTMFSPAKLIVAAALLAIAGGVASTGILTAPRDVVTPGGAPAAEAEPEFAIVEGSGSFLGETVVNGRTEMSDPRVGGDWEISQEMVCLPGGGYTCTKWGQATVTNEGGTWEGEWAGFHEPIASELPMGQHSIMSWLEGTGDYEGLSFISTLTGDPNDTAVRGIIYEGPIPPTVTLGAVTE